MVYQTDAASVCCHSLVLIGQHFGQRTGSTFYRLFSSNVERGHVLLCSQFFGTFFFQINTEGVKSRWEKREKSVLKRQLAISDDWCLSGQGREGNWLLIGLARRKRRRWMKKKKNKRVKPRLNRLTAEIIIKVID